ncbi:MAG: hypothetical protein V7784_19010 [Oceanospirillaceae bacterium]
MLNNLDSYFIARAIHIIAIVFWIGGVAFVTCVLIPAIKEINSAEDKLQLFEKLESRFATQAKISTVLSALSGFYMLNFLQAWPRYASIDYWWITLMTAVWLIFSCVLFIFEPWFLHKWFKRSAQKDSVKTFKYLHLMHIILLSISVVAVAGGVLGSHGYL